MKVIFVLDLKNYNQTKIVDFDSAIRFLVYQSQK